MKVHCPLVTLAPLCKTLFVHFVHFPIEIKSFLLIDITLVRSLQSLPLRGGRSAVPPKASLPFGNNLRFALVATLRVAARKESHLSFRELPLEARHTYWVVDQMGSHQMKVSRHHVYTLKLNYMEFTD